ncbi:MAG: NAD(P)/FAD-dependent oxidoreductase [Tissierellaceae bacterium]
MSNKIIIVGGGAAGMMAAIVAKRSGADVTILERNNRVGKKLLATGNGRCNYTNIDLNIGNYHGRNPRFAYSALANLDVNQTINLFERMGITPAIEDNGKVFPLSFQSSSVLDVLRYEIEDLGIDLITESYVVNVEKKREFIVTLKDGNRYRCDKLILATGGKAMPVSGSDGSGYTIAKSFGHNIIDVFPGLVQLNLEGNIFKQISGVKFPGVARLYSKDKLLLEDRGDILFTNYGISGPPILQISRTALEYMEKKRDIKLDISIIHTKNQYELVEYLNRRFSYMPKKDIGEALIGLINKRLINPILREINLDRNKKVSNISKKEIYDLAHILTSWKFNIIGSQGWGQAQVTAGGVDTDEIDGQTMESKLVKGLYIVGELLDIDGDCGGFNLQWAWSSGYTAGVNAAQR